MLLKDHLSECTKERLISDARHMEIKGYSGLKKAALIQKIIDFSCSEKMMRFRLTCLTDGQLNLLRKACISPTAVSVQDTTDAIQLCIYLIGCFTEPADEFCVFDEVKSTFQKIDDTPFRVEQKKKGWMTECIHFFIDYYGIAPVEVIHKIYCQKVDMSLPDMINMMENMPIDIVDSAIFPGKMIGIDDLTEENPLYSKHGLLINIPLFEDDKNGQDELEYLLDQQNDKSFYIPTVQQIEEIHAFGYEQSSPAYQKLERYLQDIMNQTYEQAVTWCLNVWVNTYKENPIGDIITAMDEANVVFHSEREINEFLRFLMNAHNETRLKTNRGHRPNELIHKNQYHGMPTIVPGSSHAAEMLREAGPRLKEMGIPFDLNGDADEINTVTFPDGINGKAVKSKKKIYPNDPCPCGSGKKYKQCCGRHKK